MKNKFYRILASFTIAIMSATTVAFGDTVDFSGAAQKSAEGIHTLVKGATKWILMIVIIGIGLTLLIGSSRKKEEVKDQIPTIIAGIICIVAAGGIAGTIFGWF